MPDTTNHNYNVPNKGDTDWHKPLNENWLSFEVDIEIRDQASNRSNYAPHNGAKFLATDTEEVFLGDGANWNRLSTTGRSPSLDEINPSNNFLGIGRSDKVVPGEYFGIQAPVKAGDWGGMDVNGADPESRPFYGYATDGDERAWHDYHGANEEWRLFVGNSKKLTASEDFVGFNDAPRVNGFTEFAFRSTRSGWGGMYMDSTDTSTGRPFYGYSIDGNDLAWHEYNHDSEEWILDVLGSKMWVTSDGHVEADGEKRFVQSVETSGGEKEVVYTASESATPHTEISGVAELEDGRAEVALPDHFGWVTDGEEPIVVQITPYGGESGTRVVERSTDRFVVEDLDGEGDYEFAYTVKGTREGYADKEVVREPRDREGMDAGESGPIPADD